MGLPNEQINHMFTNKYSTTKVILMFYFTKFGRLPKVLICMCKSYISISFTLNTHKWKYIFFQVFLYSDTPLVTDVILEWSLRQVVWIKQYILVAGFIDINKRGGFRHVVGEIFSKRRKTSRMCILRLRTLRGNSLHCTAENSIPIPNF